MGYLPEPKTTNTFVTACKALQDGRARKISLEIRPEFAILQLAGSRKRYPLAWERIFDLARKLDDFDQQLERKHRDRSKKPTKNSK